MPDPHLTIYQHPDYPGYAVLALGLAFIPVILDADSQVGDCFTSSGTARQTNVRAFTDLDDAWDLIARDYESSLTHHMPGKDDR